MNGTNGIDADVAGVVQYTKNEDGTFNKNEVNLNPGGNGPTTITNVADGKNPSDAVNVNQLSTATNKWVTGNPETYKAPSAIGVNATAIG
ncbi:MAG: hypothetical protein EOO29_03875, partial [Comamonadaceae bacterium]